MEVASPGQVANGHTPSTPAPAIVDPALVVRHLVDLLEVTLGASTEDLESKGSLLADSKRGDTVQRCTRFASESQVALYVQKDAVSPDIPNGTSNGHLPLGRTPSINEISLFIDTFTRKFYPLHLFDCIRNLVLFYDRCFSGPY